MAIRLVLLSLLLSSCGQMPDLGEEVNTAPVVYRCNVYIKTRLIIWFDLQTDNVIEANTICQKANIENHGDTYESYELL